MNKVLKSDKLLNLGRISTNMTSLSEESRNVIPEYIVHEVAHCQQRYSWDCGVSCVLMSLAPAQRQLVLDHWEDVCREEGFGHSTWTIDLCYLLKRFNVKHSMYTINMGVNEEYRKKKYYDKIFDKDRDRVLLRFAEASTNGIKCIESSLSTEHLLAHLARHGPLILLVDNGLLHCDICKLNKLYTEFRRCLGGEYRGHYVLVVGYDARRRRFVYRDPAVRARLCACSYARLQRARLAPGTDHDLVLLYTTRHDTTTG